MTVINPGESKTFSAEIPQGEVPKEIKLNVHVDIWDDPLLVAVALLALTCAGFIVGWSWGTVA
jgi:hypothetical protein